MAILIFIQFILVIILLSIFKFKFYDDKYFTERCKLPIWFYLLAIVISIIPIIGSLWSFILIGVIINLLKQKDAYYKPGWFIKILLKEI